MRRLMKKANAEYLRFLDNLLINFAYDDGHTEEILSENPDCSYNGTAYRSMFFESDEVKEHRDNFLQENDTDIDNVDQKQLVDYIVNNLVQVNGNYQSFAKSLNGIRAFYSNAEIFGTEILIKCEVSNALDIGLLCDKLTNQGSDHEILRIYEEYRREEEILCKIDSNFELVNFDQLVKTIINL